MLRLMVMPVLARRSAALASLALTAACATGGATRSGPVANEATEEPRGTASCGSTAADRSNSGDFSNSVYWDGTEFIASTPTSDDTFGDVVGRVRCTISGSLTPADYESQDGDATYIRAGDALHRVAGRPASEVLGAYVHGTPYIFVNLAEYRERSAGRCTVPLTQRCPS